MAGEFKPALGAAYRMLARRDHSVHEIRASLLKKEFPSGAVEEVIAHLSQKRFLDDRKFAAAYADMLSRTRKAGPRYIQQALLKKGIDRGLAQEAVDALFAGTGREADEIRGWIGKKAAKLKKGLTAAQKKKRIFDFLLRRGFSYDAVMDAIGKKRFEE